MLLIAKYVIAFLGERGRAVSKKTLKLFNIFRDTPDANYGLPDVAYG